MTLLNRELVSRTNLCLVSVFPDIVCKSVFFLNTANNKYKVRERCSSRGSSVTDLDARDGEVRNLKSDVDRRSTFRLVGYDARQTKVGPHEEVFAAGERLDGPDDRVGLRRVSAAARCRLELG